MWNKTQPNSVIQTEKINKKSAVTLAVTNLLNHSPRGTELGQNGFHCHTDRADQSWKKNNGLQLNIESHCWVKENRCTAEQRTNHTFLLLQAQRGQAKTSHRKLHIFAHPGRLCPLYRAGKRDTANSWQGKRNYIRRDHEQKLQNQRNQNESPQTKKRKWNISVVSKSN